MRKKKKILTCSCPEGLGKDSPAIENYINPRPIIVTNKIGAPHHKYNWRKLSEIEEFKPEK